MHVHTPFIRAFPAIKARTIPMGSKVHRFNTGKSLTTSQKQEK